MFAQTRGFPFLPGRVDPWHAEGRAATGQAHVDPVNTDTSSTMHLAGSCTSASDLDDLLDSPDELKRTFDAIQSIVDANHLGTTDPKIRARLHKHKQINTKEGQVIYSRSLADNNRVARLRSCKAVFESVTDGLDQTPLTEWTQQLLQDRTDGMYCAIELARQLNVKRQNTPFVSSGTLFDLDTMPSDQHLILKDMLGASPVIFGHVMAQMISNPSLPIHTPDLPSKAKMLDANTRLLMTQGNYPSLNECLFR